MLLCAATCLLAVPAHAQNASSAQNWHLIGATSVPPALAALVDQTLADVQAFYTTRLGPPRLKPKFSLTYSSEARGAALQGETTSDGTVTLKWSGPTWQTTQPSSAMQVRLLVARELFHLWNVPTDQPPWLSAGSAEYAAALTERELGNNDRQLWLGSISQHLNTCRLKIDLAPLSDARDGPAAHECGLVIQWLSDLDTRWTFGDKHGFFTVWGSLLADSMETHQPPRPDDFFRAGFTANDPSRARKSAEALLNDSGNDRWDTLAQSLRALGLQVNLQTDDRALRDRLVLHVLSQSCSAGYYFSTSASKVQIKVSAPCGAFTENIEVDAVEGHNLFTDANGAYEAVRKNCLAGTDVKFTKGNDVQVKAPCKAAMPDARATFALKEP